jgi:hypothetical protein
MEPGPLHSCTQILASFILLAYFFLIFQRLLLLKQQKIQRFSLVIEGMVDTPITEHLMMNRYNFLVHGLLQVCNPPHPNLLKMLQSNDK